MGIIQINGFKERAKVQLSMLQIIQGLTPLLCGINILHIRSGDQSINV